MAKGYTELLLLYKTGQQNITICNTLPYYTFYVLISGYKIIVTYALKTEAELSSET
jgi:hypothetical protein